MLTMQSKTKTTSKAGYSLNNQSRYITRGLRHDPASLRVQPDGQGWVEVSALLAGLAAQNRPLSRGELDQIVRENDKQRLTFAIDGKHIRAAQGHSIPIDLGLPACEPPVLLYHGTVAAKLAAIRAEGLKPMRRHAVHLSGTLAVATSVGARRGAPVILVIDAQGMTRGGYRFSRSDNGVWLTDVVPVRYIQFPG